MTTRRHPQSGAPVTCRIPEAELARVEIAARLTGTSRCRYVARAAVERAARDLERLAQRPANHSERKYSSTREGEQ